MKYLNLFAVSATFATICVPIATAHESDGGNVTYATDHAPIGVMADHRHNRGEWMVSYRYMNMQMEGIRNGDDSLSDPDILATPNRFAPPANLRVVPLDMTMQMHMVGAMYGLSDRVTLMAMGMYTSNDMDHRTYQGMMGSTELGEFTTETSGIGDTTIGAIIGLDDGMRPHDQPNLSLALSLPTGSIEETDQILTPMGTTPSPRLPYAMQLGSGTYDLKPSLTMRKRVGQISLGGQIAATVRLDDNDSGYTLGDIYEVTAWATYEFTPSVSLSGRLKASTKGEIDGMDANIMAPVQTADPSNYGGDEVTALLGINLAGQGSLKGHRLAAEIGLPLYRDLNGPQLETDLTFTLGWQKAF